MKKILKISLIAVLSLAIVLTAVFLPQYINKVGVFKEKEIKFTVFSDSHYRTDMSPTSVQDLEYIFDRAEKTESDFVIHCGDFCNEFVYAPAFLKAYLNNKPGIAAYGVYGNHELERDGRMDVVTANLTNDENVVWGTKDGKMAEDGSIGYYYFEKNGFRIVCVDTNYYYSHGYGEWRHNENDSYGPPSGVEQYNGLGPKQLEWLEEVLTEAAKKDIPCIVFSHTTFCPSWNSDCSQANEVREIFEKVNEIREKTVLMAVNGHYHSYRTAQIDDIVYFSLPAAIYAGHSSTEHYTDEHTYTYSRYDETEGYLIGEYERKYSDLLTAKNTWYAEDPLNAVVTINENGDINIEGMETTWVCNFAPPGRDNPSLPSSSFTLSEEE